MKATLAFYMVIRKPEWRRLMGLLTPPAQSSQQPLSQVPANRSPCLWSQSGLSGDRAPFPRLKGVRGAKNFTLFFSFFLSFLGVFSRKAINLLFFSSFSGFVFLLPCSFPPGGVKSQQASLSEGQPFLFLVIPGQIHIALSPVSTESFQGHPHLLP